jgi:hypothetical protein
MPFQLGFLAMGRVESGNVCSQFAWHPMTQLDFRPLYIVPARALIALAACLLWPGFARATCGNFVMVDGVQVFAGRSVARREISVSLARLHRHASTKWQFPFRSSVSAKR